MIRARRACITAMAVLLTALLACAPPAAQEHAVDQLFAGERSGVMVTLDADVEKVLSDDNRGDRHQRFIVRMPSGLTLLVAHNIDLAPRVDGIARGDPVRIHGQYEWNPKGGVIHWTHHDPDGRHPGGWIEHHGDRYE